MHQYQQMYARSDAPVAEWESRAYGGKVDNRVQWSLEALELHVAHSKMYRPLLLRQLHFQLKVSGKLHIFAHLRLVVGEILHATVLRPLRLKFDDIQRMGQVVQDDDVPCDLRKLLLKEDENDILHMYLLLLPEIDTFRLINYNKYL